jgi:hypothetical protein
VLTVSDIEGFAASGGMIHFVTLEDKVRFEINLKEAKLSNSNLVLSSSDWHVMSSNDAGDSSC